MQIQDKNLLQLPSYRDSDDQSTHRPLIKVNTETKAPDDKFNLKLKNEKIHELNISGISKMSGVISESASVKNINV